MASMKGFVVDNQGWIYNAEEAISEAIDGWYVKSYLQAKEISFLVLERASEQIIMDYLKQVNQ